MAQPVAQYGEQPFLAVLKHPKHPLLQAHPHGPGVEATVHGDPEQGCSTLGVPRSRQRGPTGWEGLYFFWLWVSGARLALPLGL